MDIFDISEVGTARPFDFIEPDQGFAHGVDEWLAGRIPESWYRAYRKPIRILANSLSRYAVQTLLARDDWKTGREIAWEIEKLIEEKHGFRPTLPPVDLRIENGGVAAWRHGRGQFLAMPCNGCGEIVPAYWLENANDRARATRLERRHPAIPFIHPRAGVYFEHGEFVGCFCLESEMVPEVPEERRETA